MTLTPMIVVVLIIIIDIKIKKKSKWISACFLAVSHLIFAFGWAISLKVGLMNSWVTQEFMWDNYGMSYIFAMIGCINLLPAMLGMGKPKPKETLE